MLSKSDWAKISITEEERKYLLLSLEEWPTQLRHRHWVCSVRVVKNQITSQATTPARYLWGYINPAVPPERVIRNKCGYKGCCNPFHFSIGPYKKVVQKQVLAQRKITTDMIDLADYLVELMSENLMLNTWEKLANYASSQSGIPTKPEDCQKVLEAVYPHKALLILQIEEESSEDETGE